VKAIVTGVLIAVFALAGCSTEPSDEELALDYAYNACLLWSEASDLPEEIGAAYDDPRDSYVYWRSYEIGVVEARTPANQAAALDSTWDRLATSIGDLAVAVGSLTASWRADDTSAVFADVADLPIAEEMSRGFGLVGSECARVNDVLALTQEPNASGDTSNSNDNGSTNREAEAILTAVAGVVSIALFVAVLWFVWWMAGRKNRNQTLYIILAIFFPLIMIIAVLVQKKLPDPQSVSGEHEEYDDKGESDGANSRH